LSTRQSADANGRSVKSLVGAEREGRRASQRDGEQPSARYYLWMPGGQNWSGDSIASQTVISGGVLVSPPTAATNSCNEGSPKNCWNWSADSHSSTIST
jgi:hypothetical protein